MHATAANVKCLHREITNMNEACSQIVIESAKAYIDFMGSNHANWEKAFFRFNVNPESDHGGNRSYIVGGNVELLGSLRNREICSALTAALYKLWEELDKEDKGFLVCLLVIDSDFDYNVFFEHEDKAKWEISQMDGGTGIPNGY